MHPKIDIVYLWVDGNDPHWREQKNHWIATVTGKIPADANGEDRWRDNDELRYSMRSVCENLPWVNHIYLITGFGQIPKWLDTTNPKITIVPHEQIFPTGALPTFNATSIEMCIPNIPGLSEHFLICNDDFFVLRKLAPNYFYDVHDRAIFRHSLRHDINPDIEKWISASDQYTATLLLSAKYIHEIFGRDVYKYRPSHGIDPYFKSTWIKLRNHPALRDQIDTQIYHKFRQRDEVQRQLFNLGDFATGRARFVHARAPKTTRHKIFDWIYNTIFFIPTRKSTLCCTDVGTARNAIKRASVLCINDSPSSTDETRRTNAAFLESRFPNKCEFEK